MIKFSFKELLEISMLSSKDAAKLLGVTPQIVRNWKSGRTICPYKPMDVMQAYCKHLKKFTKPERKKNEQSNRTQ